MEKILAIRAGSIRFVFQREKGKKPSRSEERRLNWSKKKKEINGKRYPLGGALSIPP